jgi:hypothetical protein
MKNLIYFILVLLALIIIVNNNTNKSGLKSVYGGKTLSIQDALDMVIQKTQIPTYIFIQNSFKKDNGKRLLIESSNGNLLKKDQVTINQISYALKNKFASDDKVQYFSVDLQNFIIQIKIELANYVSIYSKQKKQRPDPTNPSKIISIDYTSDDFTLYDVIQGLKTDENQLGVFNEYLKSIKFYSNSENFNLNQLMLEAYNLGIDTNNSKSNIILNIIEFEVAKISNIPLAIVKILQVSKDFLFEKWFYNNSFSPTYPSPICSKSENIKCDSDYIKKTLDNLKNQKDPDGNTIDISKMIDLTKQNFKLSLIIALIKSGDQTLTLTDLFILLGKAELMVIDRTHDNDPITFIDVIIGKKTYYNDNDQLINYLDDLQNNKVNGFEHIADKYRSFKFTWLDLGNVLEYTLKNSDQFFLDIELGGYVSGYFIDKFGVDIRPEDISDNELLIYLKEICDKPEWEYIGTHIIQPAIIYMNTKLRNAPEGLTPENLKVLDINNITPTDVACAIHFSLLDVPEDDTSQTAIGFAIKNSLNSTKCPDIFKTAIVVALNEMSVIAGGVHKSIDDGDFTIIEQMWKKKKIQWGLLAPIEKYVYNFFLIVAKIPLIDKLFADDKYAELIKWLGAGGKKATSAMVRILKNIVIPTLQFFTDILISCIGKDNVEKFLQSGLAQSAKELFKDVTAEYIFAALDGIGMAYIVFDCVMLIVQNIWAYCPCDYPKRELPFGVPVCYKSSCEEEFPANDNREFPLSYSTAGLCATQCGKRNGSCYYNNGSWCANNLWGGCILQDWVGRSKKSGEPDFELKPRSSHVAIIDKSVCEWTDTNMLCEACKYGFIETCPDILKQPMINLFTTFCDNNVFECKKD